VADNLNRLNTITQQLTRLDKDVGSEDDGAQLRGDMKRLRDEGQDIIKKTRALLTQSYDRAQRAKHDKLQAQLTELSTQFEKVAKVTINKEMEKRLSQIPSNTSSSSKNPYDSSSGSSGFQTQARPQQQTQVQATANVDQIVLEERNKEIKELEKELVELSEVFVDVMKLTKEQGEDLQTVQNNTTSAAIRTDEGVGELKQASKYQCTYRKRMAILAFIILVVIVIVIIIAVVVGQKNSKKN